MVKLLCVSVVSVAAIVLVLGTQRSATAHAQLLPSVVACRHDASESQTDRARREQAVALARAINATEGRLIERTRSFHPLADLPNLPTTPRGFELRLYSDGSGYVFSIKDALDQCGYGVFSDQAGLLYEKTPRPAPLVATR
jgi:hypothetical protein